MKIMINKEKNVLLQITFPKEDAEQLETTRLAFLENGVKVSKSEILLQAFKTYLKLLIMANESSNKADKVEEPQGDQKDA